MKPADSHMINLSLSVANRQVHVPQRDLMSVKHLKDKPKCSDGRRIADVGFR